MKFVIGIESGSEKTAWGVVVPDLPGCLSAGDAFDEAVDNAREAIELYCEVLAAAPRARQRRVPAKARRRAAA